MSVDSATAQTSKRASITTMPGKMRHLNAQAGTMTKSQAQQADLQTHALHAPVQPIAKVTPCRPAGIEPLSMLWCDPTR